MQDIGQPREDKWEAITDITNTVSKEYKYDNYEQSDSHLLHFKQWNKTQ